MYQLAEVSINSDVVLAHQPTKTKQPESEPMQLTVRVSIVKENHITQQRMEASLKTGNSNLE